MLTKAAKRRARRAKLEQARGYDMREIARLTGQSWSRAHGYHMGARAEFVPFKGINVRVSNIRGSGLGRIFGKTIGKLGPIMGTVSDPYTWASDTLTGKRTRTWDAPLEPVIGLVMWDERPGEAGYVMRKAMAWHHEQPDHGMARFDRHIGEFKQLAKEAYFGSDWTPCMLGHALVECYCKR